MLTSADNKQITEGQAESKTTALEPSTTQSTELDNFSNEINSVNQPRVLRATSLPSFHPSIDTIANDQVRILRLMFLRLRYSGPAELGGLGEHLPSSRFCPFS